MLKRFDFFSRFLVTSDGIALDHRALNAQQSGHEAFLSEDFTCCGAGGGRFALGDARGGITLMGAISLKPRRFSLLEGETVAAIQLVPGDVLVVVSASCQVRVYKLATGSAEVEEPPRLINRLNTPTNAWKKRGLPPLSPNCIAVTKDSKNMAIGFRDGFVLWMRFKDLRDENAHEEPFMWLTPSSTFAVAGACTGLGFTPDAQALWASFEKQLVIFDDVGTESILDREEGCRLNCSCVGPDPSFFVLGKKDRVAFYTTETAGSCYSILGERERLFECRDHIVVVSSGEIWRGISTISTSSSSANSAAASSSSTTTSLLTKGKKPQQQESVSSSAAAEQRQTIQILDLQNKFVAHEFPLWRDSGDKCAFIAGDEDTGSVFVLTEKRRRLWRMQEKPIEVKLDDLLKRNLYSTAAALAKSSGCEPGFVADIYRRYGDHLYEKGSYDDAVAQFVLTVGRVEPSYVIRKFLDAPRVKNLTSYLETLHRVGTYQNKIPEWADSHHKFDYLYSDPNQPAIPSADHTTLLLTCYAKLKEEDKIDQLLQNQEARLDVDAALSVLKETGRILPALKLAKERQRGTWYVKTLLELADTSGDLSHAKTALEYIIQQKQTSSSQNNNINPKSGEEMFRLYGAQLMALLPNETLNCAKRWIEQSTVSIDELLDSFADYPLALEQLCKTAIAKEEDESSNSRQQQHRLPSTSMWNTCLELSLAHGHLESAYEILTHPRSNVDFNFALAAVRRFKFRKGEMFLHEKSQRWDLLLQCRMMMMTIATDRDLNQPNNVLLEQESDRNESLLTLAKTKLAKDADSWMSLLRYFSSKPASSERDGSIREALRHIEQYDVLPPLLALRVLSEHGEKNGIQLGVVRPYLIGQIQRASQKAQADQDEVRQLREDTARMRAEAKTLTTEPKVFNATTCCMTGAPLELPVVHFMSGNSYNLSSLPSSSLDKLEDPKCAQDQNAVFDIARGLARRRQDVDEEFFSELQMAQGGESGFALVADYFGKCLFDEDDTYAEER